MVGRDRQTRATNAESRGALTGSSSLIRSTAFAHQIYTSHKTLFYLLD